MTAPRGAELRKRLWSTFVTAYRPQSTTVTAEAAQRTTRMQNLQATAVQKASRRSRATWGRSSASKMPPGLVDALRAGQRPSSRFDFDFLSSDHDTDTGNKAIGKRSTMSFGQHNAVLTEIHRQGPLGHPGKEVLPNHCASPILACLLGGQWRSECACGLLCAGRGGRC